LWPRIAGLAYAALALNCGPTPRVNALARFDRVGDLFEGVLKRPQKLDSAIQKLAGAVRR
jgi:hypothetical protein